MSDDETDAGGWQPLKMTLPPQLKTVLDYAIGTVNALLLRKVLERIVDASGRNACKIHALQRTRMRKCMQMHCFCCLVHFNSRLLTKAVMLRLQDIKINQRALTVAI